MKSKIGSLSGYVLAVAGLCFLIFNKYIISTNPIVITIQIASVVLMIWARITFKSRSFHVTADPTRGDLVTNGPYRYLRHPIYASVIYFSWACLIAFPRIEALMAVQAVTAGLFTRMLFEEKELKKAYPEYGEYSKKAKRLIPFIF